MKLKRALISVYDKTGITRFAKGLADAGIEIISTGGTKRVLEDSGIEVRGVSEVTGFPEMLGGRVKTLHPAIHAALLADTGLTEHSRDIRNAGISPIGMVVVNLYPFATAVAERPDDVENAVENIDIGGPAIIRSAAKNYKHVAVVTDPEDYESVLEEIRKSGGLSEKRRAELAVKAFRLVADYDSEIDRYFSRKFGKEEIIRPLFVGGVKLRYGENPHQKGMWFRDPSSRFSFSQLYGKEISYNNLLDMASAISITGEFKEPACAIVKHNNPCGAAVGRDCLDAYRKALETDRVSAFGGVVSFNRELDRETAEELNRMFLEVVIAPGYSEEAVKELKKKRNLIVIKTRSSPDFSAKMDFRRIPGGLLAQDMNTKGLEENELKVVTERKPDEREVKAMLFGWRVLKYVKSNAVIFVSPDRTLAIGAGQTSRVDSVKIAVMKARSLGIELRGSVVCSDAFFPFRDGIDEAAGAGASAAVQPGGSVRDSEVIEAANEHGMAMAFTGFRCFRH